MTEGGKEEERVGERDREARGRKRGKERGRDESNKHPDIVQQELGEKI